MDEQAAFGVVVRTLGLMIALYGMWYALWGFAKSLGAKSSLESEKQADRVYDFALWGAILVAFGVGVILAANAIVNFAYPLRL